MEHVEGLNEGVKFFVIPEILDTSIMPIRINETVLIGSHKKLLMCQLIIDRHG